MTIKRYHPRMGGDAMGESECGDYVRYEDYAKLLSGRLQELEELREENINLRDPRMWSVVEILERLDALAKRCDEEDWCSMAPTELSYCATKKAVIELRARLGQPQTENQT